jgi:hypothetical protein
MSTSTFAASYKGQLWKQYAGCCVCLVRHNLHVAHIFDKHATMQLEEQQRRGLVNLDSLGDYDNAIYLCPGDHAAFDARQAQLIIVPAYLDFFIDQEQRWQSAMKTAPTLNARSAVLSALYADHCTEQRGTMMNGLYTAYPMVDYKRRDTVEPPTEFQWHGDPGAIIWKAQKLLVADLAGLSWIPHVRDLKEIRRKLGELRNLREEGDDEWALMMAAHTPSDGPRPGASESSRDNGGDSHDSGQPHARTTPPPLPPSGSAGAEGQSYPSASKFTSLVGAPLYDTHFLKRKRALFDVEISEDVVRVDSPHKRIKSVWTGPTQRQESKPTQRQKSRPTQHEAPEPTQRSSEPRRWGGPTRSTEETVRYWNAVFGRGESTASAGESVGPEPP